MTIKKVSSIDKLEELGRVRLSKTFFMRDFLYSEIANWYGVQNFPEHPDIAIRTGTQLCEQLLEPLQTKFGRLEIRSAYRSPTVNQLGNYKTAHFRKFSYYYTSIELNNQRCELDN